MLLLLNFKCRRREKHMAVTNIIEKYHIMIRFIFVFALCTIIYDNKHPSENEDLINCSWREHGMINVNGANKSLRPQRILIVAATFFRLDRQLTNVGFLTTKPLMISVECIRPGNRKPLFKFSTHGAYPFHCHMPRHTGDCISKRFTKDE